MRWSYLIPFLLTAGFAVVMTAGLLNRLPGFGPRPGTPAWQSAIDTFVMALAMIALQYLLFDHGAVAFVTLLLGLLAIAAVQHAERVYLQRRAAGGVE